VAIFILITCEEDRKQYTVFPARHSLLLRKLPPSSREPRASQSNRASCLLRPHFELKLAGPLRAGLDGAASSADGEVQLC